MSEAMGVANVGASYGASPSVMREEVKMTLEGD